MKRLPINKMLGLLSLLIALSCSDDESLKVGSLPVEDVGSSVTNMKKFDGYEDLNSFAANSNKTSVGGRRSSASDENFTSFYDIYYQAVEKISEVSSEEQALKLLDEYRDVLTVSDSSYVPTIGFANVYGYFINRDRVYQIGSTIVKVIDDTYVVSTDAKNYKVLLAINSINGIDEKEFKVTKYNTGVNVESSAGGRTQARCGNVYLVDYYDNPSGCKNDRRVYIGTRASLVDYGTVGGYQRIGPWLTIEIWGEIRNGWCNWKPYGTDLSYRNIDIDILSYQNTSSDPIFTTSNRVNFAFNPADRTEYDSWKMVPYHNVTGTFIVGENAGDYGFTNVRIEATSRGVGNNWAVINCQ